MGHEDVTPVENYYLDFRLCFFETGQKLAVRGSFPSEVMVYFKL